MREKAIYVYRPRFGNYVRTIIKQGNHTQLLKEENPKGTKYEVLSTPNIFQKIFHAGITHEGSTIAENLTLKKARQIYNRNEKLHAKYSKKLRKVI